MLEHAAPALRLSSLALGTMNFGGQLDRQESRAVLNRAIDTGVTLIDTANGYASGASETLLGEFLRGRRDEVSLASKVGSPTGYPGTRLDPRTIRQELTGSLQRLRTNYLDLYYLHRPDRDVPLAETLGTLAELQTEGLIRATGCSNFPSFELARMHCIAAANEWEPILISQPLYNVLSRRIEDEYVEATTALGISNIVYNPLAGGLLTGRYRQGEQPDADTRFGHAQFREQYQSRYFSDPQWTALEDLRRIAGEADLQMTEIALRWLCSQPHVASILVGASSPGQLDENREYIERGPLSQDVLDACDAIRHLTHGTAPLHIK